MARTRVPVLAVTIALACAWTCCGMTLGGEPAAVQPPLSSLNLVPRPQSVTASPGARMTLGPQSRIVTAAGALKPLAEVLAEEIVLVSGQRPGSAVGKPVAGDIVLEIDPQLKGEAYTVQVAGFATVRGGNYPAVAMGTTTLLQAIQRQGDATFLPAITVADEPAVAYRGLLIDVARQYHSIATLKQIVRLCRFYKIRYLQLHLTDDQSFMFPSKAYPQLAKQNQHGGKTYTIEELNDLVAFADARGVTIVPEYEVPGHSAAANRALPDLFIIRGTKPYEHHASINFAKDEVMKAVDTIVGEMCEVFRSSPYFHIGGDEANLALADQNAEFKAACKKYNLPNQHQLYRKFVVDMDNIVKRHGKQMIVWEGFGREPNSPIQIPKDIIVMAYEIRFYMPDALVGDGYQVINASWTPLYVVNSNCRPPEEIYAWDLRQFKPFGAKATDTGVLLPPQRKVFGAQMCAWEQPGNAEIPSLRKRLPVMSERIWNPSGSTDFGGFSRRLEAADHRLESLIH